MSLEEQEFVLKLLPGGAESDRVVKLHPFRAEAGEKSRAVRGKLPVDFIPALLAQVYAASPEPQCSECCLVQCPVVLCLPWASFYPYTILINPL